jgi:hypothetical protein
VTDAVNHANQPLAVAVAAHNKRLEFLETSETIMDARFEAALVDTDAHIMRIEVLEEAFQEAFHDLSTEEGAIWARKVVAASKRRKPTKRKPRKPKAIVIPDTPLMTPLPPIVVEEAEGAEI